MKSMIRVFAIMLVLAFALSACGLPVVGQAEPSATPAPVEETPAAFGAAEVEVEATPSLQAEVTEAPTPTPPPEVTEEPSPEPEESEPPEETPAPVDPDADLTELVVKSALCADYINDLWYDPDTAFFWRSVGYLMSLAGNYSPDAESGSDDEGTYIRLPAEALEPYVTALFGDYFADEETQYPDLGEETDIVSWESTEDGEFYLVHIQDLDAYTVEYEETDWADHYNATILVDGEARAVYELTLEDAGEDALFPLSITEMAYAGKPGN